MPAPEAGTTMTPIEQLSGTDHAPRGAGASWLRRVRRFVPLAVIALGMVVFFAAGGHQHLSLDLLVHHRAAVDAFIDANLPLAVAVYILIYATCAAFSVPCGLALTISGGILFGTLVGGLAAMIGATAGATIIFLVARGACGETLIRRAGPVARKIADGFCADAFSYLLFLRLVPAFPFFLVNLAAAVVGVKPRTFVVATAIGIVPATFAFAFFGSGLDSVIAKQDAIYRDCLAAGRTDCQLHFGLSTIMTPRLLAAMVLLGLLALVPVAVKRWRAARAAQCRAKSVV